MSSLLPRFFVRSAPSKVNRHQSVALRVTDMTARDTLWWDSRLAPFHVRMSARADRMWWWSALLPACHLVQLAKRRYCRPLVIWARADNDRFLRVGMSILIERYPHLDVSTTADAHFIWFMAAAESDVLIRHFRMSNPPSLARVMVDNAIVLSMNAGLSGRIGLHASTAGGPGLLSVYVRCGLINLEATTLFPPSIRRRNDGRFFYTDEVTAERLAAALDPNR